MKHKIPDVKAGLRPGPSSSPEPFLTGGSDLSAGLGVKRSLIAVPATFRVIRV
jgi:hypothetical protein